VRRRLAGAVAVVLGIGLAAPSPGAAAPDDPTCADTLGIAVHGQHIVADYVTGLHGDLPWPPRGGTIGGAVAGAATPGGPGPGFHFANGFAPGASFCTGSHSPGIHL
jgi:hypothetical protein